MRAGAKTALAKSGACGQPAGTPLFTLKKGVISCSATMALRPV